MKALAGFVGSLALVAIVNSPPARSQGSATSTETVTTVHMKGSLFDPASGTVKVGQEVLFVNEDSFAHNVTAANNHIASGDIAAGKSWSYTFDQSGVYRYVCTYHPWMKGQITVTAAK